LKRGFEPQPTLELVDRNLSLVANWGRLERVVGHLIQNAIDATGREGRVTVRLTRAGDEAVIEVIDSGAGMSAEFIRDRLFKPFETTKSAGMGIGVFESREYVQELGGRMEVKSRPGEGTTFTITLPLAGEDATTHQDEHQEESA
jgi:signal transduction histidine kinase